MVEVGGVRFGGGQLALVAGPCVIESPEQVLEVGRSIAATCAALGVGYVLKASFDKANRTSGAGFRGPGLADGLAILREVRAVLGVPITTDVHEPGQAEAVAAVVDLLQIPAFLCRQTDLLVAAARTGRPVNVKKGQFLAPDDLGPVVDKLRAAGAAGVLVTERGTSFGYHDLVVDFRSLVTLRGLGVPVVFDATHSVQRPGAGGDRSSGDRRFAAPLGRAAAAVGVDALFAEVHPDPARARSDADTQLPLAGFAEVLRGWVAVHRAAR
ncbi:MAG: 3-deoxy-8-phosphooctulonate synthase [Myxococcota bacterium]